MIDSFFPKKKPRNNTRLRDAYGLRGFIFLIWGSLIEPLSFWIRFFQAWSLEIWFCQPSVGVENPELKTRPCKEASATIFFVSVTFYWRGCQFIFF